MLARKDRSRRLARQKQVQEWAADERAIVAANVFLRRVQHGWSPRNRSNNIAIDLAGKASRRKWPEIFSVR